ncbi:bud neck involved protein [Talaromyces marneffei ATCC 18224]|uniref:Protein BNI4 n=1 Tax=Talaromyces marneffei (strain ATCC 18224 / CBS 334.59 / QM 7333) TaxID=441960 RepID=B6QBL5_TALMQ|nr:uncharacterized protein EYB26_006164 [Talaromyces marneffei]EEA26456.1 conserved hypothetical protein [Talaromyces marneffei ATCC 18224]QGA18479.1 hypothetical protein EYB26_006164 [Talaromyces marneffei]
MAALVQTIPQQNGTVTLLQTRPASSTAQNSFISTPQIAQPHVGRGHSMSLSSYTGVNNSANRNSVAPYAFTSTPGLLAGNTNQQRSMAWSPQVRPDSLSSTSLSQNNIPNPSSHFAAGSVPSSSGSSNSSSRPSYISQDDSILSSRRRTTDVTPRPLSTINLSAQYSHLALSTSTSTPSSASTSPPSTSTPSKPLPDRYRRVKRTNTDDNTASQPAVAIPVRSSSYDLSATAVVLPQPVRPAIVTHTRTPSADDGRVGKQLNPDVAKRYRRRSWANMDAFSQEPPLDSSDLFAPLPDLKFTTPALSRPASSNSEKSNSVDGQVENKTSVPNLDSKFPTNASHNPSPLSNQVASSPAPAPTPTPSNPTPSALSSPAAQRLADISKASAKKPGKSRLRRAFSFGSAAELRKVSVQNSMGRREGELSANTGDELDPEQAAIAAQQEANGLGNNIYSHQLGSTDNISISSTASSASIMLRKMGRGMKKSTRSLVGLFRPKSVLNENTEPMVTEPTAPQLSVVNIEAERKIVTANPDPHDQSGGGTVFPKIQPTNEKSKAAVVVNNNVPDVNSRKSIVGGERERAEVLAAVKKGILKRSGSASPVAKPMELTPPPHIPDSPNSSAPSTPEEHSHRVGHRRTDTVKIEGEDYFMTQNKYGSESKSAPITPHPAAAKSIVFSPRIQFHETWPSGEYDRRGDTATCNKLTPLLAQQIKEELNTFKMEMEVHETSKIYTHFL